MHQLTKLEYKISTQYFKTITTCVSTSQQDATLSQGVPRDAAVNFGATGIIGVADIKTRCHGIVHAVSLAQHGFLA